MDNRIKLLVLFGIRGVGKSYLVNSLVKNYPEYFYKVKQVTTRPRRENEAFEEYIWLNKDEYEAYKDQYFAKTEVMGNYYGTVLSYIHPDDQKKIGLIIVDCNGLRDFGALDITKYNILKVGLDTTNQYTVERNTDEKKLEDNMKAFSEVDFIIKTEPNKFITPSKFVNSIIQYCIEHGMEQFITPKK